MKEVFEMIPPATQTGSWIMLSVTVLMVALALLFGSLAFKTGQASFEISEAGLRLRGDWYGRMIPAQALKIAQARAVNLRHEIPLQPNARTMGTALPGYQAGWFRLNNDEKALVYLTDHSQVVYLPTTEGYAVLLSVPQPEAFLASLRRIASS